MADQRLSLLQHQLALAFDKRSWHGPNLRGSLRGLAPGIATFRPQPDRHNVWEIVVHCAYWKYRVCRLLDRDAPQSFEVKGSDWFRRPADDSEVSPHALAEDLALLARWHGYLTAAVRNVDPDGLDGQPSGSGFTVVELISGAIAHDLYHAGQIRLLRRMAGAKGGTR
jgi:hypothetical protein